MEATRFAVALDQQNNRCLTNRATARVLPLAGVFVALFAADIGFVDFNNLVLAA
jgi:hypothetical protein